MADRTDISGKAISTAYLQLLFVADTTGVPATGASPADSLIYSSGGKKACLKLGFDQCSIPSGSHNFDVGSHNGTYGLKLGGSIVTASAAELNYNDVAAAGTTQASKSMVTDSNGAICFPDSNATTHRLDFGASSDLVMYHDGSNSYIRNKTGALKIATEASGIAVTIGHTTSETTVADNLNTTGLIRVNDTTEATSTTDGSLQTDGGLSVVKSAVIGDDLDLLSDSAILTMGAGKDFTITHDGTTGAALVGNPITITSTGAGTWSTSSGALTLTSAAAATWSTAAGALTLTSAAAATWSAAAGALVVDAAASTLTLDGHTGVTVQSSNSGDVTLDSVADVVIDGAGGNIEFKDAGVLQLSLDMDGTAGVQILKLGVDTDDLVFQQYDGNEVCRMADDRRLYFYDKGGEYIYGDGTDLYLVSGADINIPVNIGLRFGDGNQHIETDNTDFTITSDVAINLNSPVLDIVNQGTTIELKQQVDALAFDGASDNILNIDASNNRVGVGTAAPEAKLHILTGDASIAPVGSADDLVIEGSGHTGMSILGGAGSSMTIAFGDSGDADIGQISYDHGSNAMSFIVAASNAITIDSSRQVGIGTTSPDTLLEVVGSFAANGPSSTFVTMASGDTSPDISTGNIFKSHTDGVTIDQFDGGICGQIITIISGGATVYDVTSSELNGGTTNITTAAGDVTMWVCESATDWHLLSWMDLSIDLSSGGF